MIIGLAACSGSNTSDEAAETDNEMASEEQTSETEQSGQNLADNAGSGSWLEGKRFAGGASEDEIRTWIDGLQ